MGDQQGQQQCEQRYGQEVLIDVPEEEEQVGEAEDGVQATQVQEVHATRQSEGREGTTYEPT
jgi:hypothetical protein